MTIRFDNYAKKAGRRGSNDWYQWRIFVNENEAVLDKIDYVSYILHPTFPNPIRIVRDRESKFALESAGWGSFTMFITIRFKDGTEQEVRYFLDLGKKWPD